jgi:hypothetical protein
MPKMRRVIDGGATGIPPQRARCWFWQRLQAVTSGCQAEGIPDHHLAQRRRKRHRLYTCGEVTR